MNIEQLVKSYVNFNSSNHTWHNVVCPICNDYKVRAAFRFDNNGESCTYHCFNHSSCGGAYNPQETAGFMSANFKNVLHHFGISEIEIKELIFRNNLQYNSKNTSHSTTKKDIPIKPTSLLLPSYFNKLDIVRDAFSEECVVYLKDRCIDYKKFDFYYTTKTPIDVWDYRLIIPAFYKDQLVHYQGRDILDIHEKRYYKINTPIENVLYNMNELFRNTTETLLVFEGVFDGLCLSNNFVAITSSNFSLGQIKWLKNTKRRIVIVPDIDISGLELIKQAIDNGFEISFPKLPINTDINECVKKFGQLFVLKEIFSNIYKEDEARIRLELLKMDLT